MVNALSETTEYMENIHKNAPLLHRGFEYMHVITDAVSKYTEHEISKNKNAFKYRGFDLRYAVERNIFFDLMNAKDVIDAYRHPNQLNSGDVDLKRIYHRFIFTELNINFKSIKKNKLFVLLINKIKWVYREIRLFNWTSIFNQGSCDQISILIHIKHEKFIRYFEPIEEHLQGIKYAYLVTSDHSLTLALRAMGKPVIESSGHHSWIGELFISNTISKFESLVSLAENIYAALRSIKPKCIVVMEGNADIDVVISEVGKALLIPTLCIQQGWCPVIHTGFRNMSFEKMFVWGKKFERMLGPFNRKQNFIVSGSHVLQGLSDPKMRPYDDRSLISIGFFLQPPGIMLSDDELEEFISLIHYVASKFPEIHIIVREHPGQLLSDQLKKNLYKIHNIRLLSPGRYSLKEVFQQIDLSVSIYSTTILESLAANVVPLICGLGSMPPYYPNLVADSLALEATGISDAKRLINKILSNPSILNVYRENILALSSEYFAELDAAKLISDEIKKYCMNLKR